MQKLLIKNAQVATSKEVFNGAVLAENGAIAEIYREGDALPGVSAAETIDAGGQYLLPGGVDPHTHFDLDVGFTRASDTFYTGTVAAACGGTTTVIDHMAFGPKGCALTHQPAVYHKLAQDSVLDYGFHGTIQHVDSGVLNDMATLKEEGITSLKLYMTYDDKICDNDIISIMRKAKELNLVICAHCENDAIVTRLRKEYTENGKTQAKYHPLSRPGEAEAEAVFRLLMLTQAAGGANVYIVHLSSALGLAAAQLARKNGQSNIFLETCPQYLFLSDSLYQDPAEGLKYVMSPPLRGQNDINALWHALEHGEIDTIGTDHCPFFFETQKQRGAQNFTLCPNGAPGVELRMPLLFSEGFLTGKLTLPQVVNACCTRPAQIFGIAQQKGDIIKGADADLVLINPHSEWVVTKTDLHENVDYTPYEGMKLKCRVTQTISRGETIYKNGEFTGHKGRGQYLKRGTIAE